MMSWQPFRWRAEGSQRVDMKKTADVGPPFEQSASAGWMTEGHIVGPDHRSRKRCAVPGLTIRMMK
jgi:hypothetical protein